MTSRNSEGYGEIEANTRHLRSSEKAASLTARNLETAIGALKTAEDEFTIAKDKLDAARKAAEGAQKEHDEAEADMKDAKSCLEAAQKKWEVIDDDDEKPESSSDDSKERAESRATKKPKRASDNHDEVAVEGCGLSEINGIYTRCGSGALGPPKYSKTGLWKGEERTFVIRYISHFESWHIMIPYEEKAKKFPYFCYNASGTPDLPPAIGWCCMASGKEPAPKIVYNCS